MHIPLGTRSVEFDRGKSGLTFRDDARKHWISVLNLSKIQYLFLVIKSECTQSFYSVLFSLFIQTNMKFKKKTRLGSILKKNKTYLGFRDGRQTTIANEGHFIMPTSLRPVLWVQLSSFSNTVSTNPTPIL